MAEPKDVDFNQDQIFSAARHVMAFVGAMWLANAGTDVTNLVVGVVPIAAAMIWALWRNVDNKLDMLVSGMRQIVTIASGFAVAKGWVTDEVSKYIGGTVVALLNGVLSQLFYQNAPGPKLAGTTIVEPPEN